MTTFGATGGESPYVFELVTGGGELDATSGVFRAPPYPGAATIEVTDASGAVASTEVSFGGDYLYVAGGFINNLARDEVWRSADGVSWEVIGRLPAPRGGGAMWLLDDRLIFAGGSDAPEGTGFDEVWSSTDGITWTDAGRLPKPTFRAATAVYRGRMWLVGGRIPGDDFAPQVLSSADGASWQVEPPLAVGLHGGELEIVDDAMWLLAGHEAARMTATILKRLDDGSWVPIGAVPTAGEHHSTMVRSGELWVAGGLGLNDRVVTSIDGTSWIDRARFPLRRDFGRMIEWQDAAWVVAGGLAETWRSTGGEPWTMVGAIPGQLMDANLEQFTPVL